MNNRYMFCFLLLANAGLQSMESKIEALPDWKEKENILADHYKAFLEKQLNNWQDAEENEDKDEVERDRDLTLDLEQLIGVGDLFGIQSNKAKEVLNNVRIKGGNNITHLLVMHHYNSILVKYAEQDLISLEKNEEGLTAFDIAFSQFSSLVKKIEKNESNEKIGDKDVQNLKCLYLVLHNYIKTKENADHKKELTEYRHRFDDDMTCIWCCKHHSY